jgi:hypothetical protein
MLAPYYSESGFTMIILFDEKKRIKGVLYANPTTYKRKAKGMVINDSNVQNVILTL